MPKEKLTLTLDVDNVRALRDLVGARSLSASVDAAVAEHLALLRHLAAVDEWLMEMDSAHGPVPTEVVEWAAGVVHEWDASRTRSSASR